MMNCLWQYNVIIRLREMNEVTAYLMGTNRKVDNMYHKKKYSSFLLMSVLMLLPLTGCSKDEILNQYNNVVQSAGNATLTGDLSLKGKRTYGDDHYTGTYVADYKDFSKTEYLFGGTSIERENGKDISVSCNLEITEGTAQVFWISGSDDPVVLLEASDGYSETLTLPEGGNYFGITGDNFTGHLEMNIE